MGISLLSKKNLKSTAEASNGFVEKIKANLGLDELTLDVDWEAIDKEGEASGRPNVPGDIINWYLEALQSNTQYVKSDELVLEAVIEAVGKTVALKFEVTEEDTGKYVGTKLEQGVITFVIPRSKFAANVDNIFKDVEEQL